MRPTIIGRMRFLIPLFVVLSACDSPADQSSSFVVGRLENSRIDEASGIARSQRHPDVFWVMNDDGPAALYAIDANGKHLARVRIKGAKNRDWEDLASFTLDGTPYLLVADIGDNMGERKDVRIYVVAEPESGAEKVDVAWQFDFEYPEGPRDAESVAIDIDNGRILVLTKRDVPARLYSLPLQPETDERQQAEHLGVLASLPQPSQSDLAFATQANSWHWQPTSMDISDDNAIAAVLTYGGVFIYRRDSGADWRDVLQGPPAVLSLTRNRQAESIAFDRGAEAVVITLEGRNPRLFRLPLSGPQPD